MKKIKQHKQKEPVVKQDERDWKHDYMRAIADYHNLENRQIQQIDHIKQTAGKHIIIKLLDILDELERAESFINDPGLILIKQKVITLLEEEGVVEIDVLGKVFNPEQAECLSVENGKKDNIVTKVVKKGYMMHNCIIRHAQVIVSKTL